MSKIGVFFTQSTRSVHSLCGCLEKFSDVFSYYTPSKILFLSLLVFSTMLGGKKGKLRSAVRKAATANRAAKRRSGSGGSSGGSEGDPRFGPRPSGYPRPPPFDHRCFGDFCRPEGARRTGHLTQWMDGRRVGHGLPRGSRSPLRGFPDTLECGGC
jgi:hypothetical protein